MIREAYDTARPLRASIHLHPAMNYEQRIGVLLRLLDEAEQGEAVNLV